MAYPGDISNDSSGLPVEPEAMSHNPVFCDGNGNYYKVMEGPDATVICVIMMKSTDNGQTWAEVDGANRHTEMRDVEGCYSEQFGDEIWVAHTRGGDYEVWFTRFRTSDHATAPDTWAALETIDDAASTGSGATQWASFARLSNGDAWFFYQNAAYKKRFANATLGSRVATSVGQYPMPAVGESDVTHLFVTTSTQVQYRTLTAAGTLSGTTRVDTTGHYGGSSAYGNTSNAVYYDNAGVETVACLYTEANGNLWLALVEDGVLSRTQISTAAVSIDQGTATGGGPDCHLAVDGTKLHMVWADNTSGDILYRTHSAGTLSDQTTLWSSGANLAWYPYCSIISRDGATYLGYTYDVGSHANSVSFVDYNETLVVSGLTQAPTDALALADSVSLARSGFTHADALGLTDSSTRTLGSRITYRCDVGVG